MENKKQVNIKIKQETSTTLSIYCKLHGKKIGDIADSILDMHLTDFKKRIAEVRKLSCDK